MGQFLSKSHHFFSLFWAVFKSEYVGLGTLQIA